MELSQVLDPKLLTEIKKIELRSKRTINADLMGQYRSAFRGSGLIFSDLREYQPGDDVKNIHWKASARTGKVYVKSYEEDRLLNIIVAIDVSRSTDFGQKRSKHRAAIEFAALLTCLALAHQDAIGLCTFSDNVEEFFPPKRARTQVHRILRRLLEPQELKPATNIAKALRHLSETQKKPSVIFVISDFLSKPYDQELLMLSLKHDVILVMLEDNMDSKLPKAGLVEFEDAENGDRIIIDTNDKTALRQLEEIQKSHIQAWKDCCLRAQTDYMRLADNPLVPFVQLMNQRAQRIR